MIATSGLRRNEKHEYFWEDEGPLPSITTVMKAVDKSGPLVGWAKKVTAEAAVRNIDMVKSLVAEGGPQAGVDFLKKLPDYKRDTAADLGTRVHAIAEAIAHGQDVELTEDEIPRVAAYRQWEMDYRPKYIASEYMVCSLEHWYAGTGDLVVDISGVRWRLDTKTSSGVYHDTGLQLAAAHFAEFSGRPGDSKRYKVPAADRHGVLHLRADGTYGMVPFDVTPETFKAFLAAAALWSWLQGQAKAIVGQPLTGGRVLDVAA